MANDYVRVTMSYFDALGNEAESHMDLRYVRNDQDSEIGAVMAAGVAMGKVAMAFTRGDYDEEFWGGFLSSITSRTDGQWVNRLCRHVMNYDNEGNPAVDFDTWMLQFVAADKIVEPVAPAAPRP